MRKVWVLLIVAALLGACSDDSEGEKEQENNTGQQDQAQSEDDAAVSFQKLNVTVEEDAVQITGRAKTDQNNVYFKFEQGDNILVEETPLELENSDQGLSTFEIEVELTQEVIKTEEVPVVVLYGKNEAGDSVNEKYVPVDLSQTQS